MIKRRIKDVVVLLGPSGSGKTTYGQTLKGPYSSFSSTSFLSTGDRLLEEGYISIYREPNMREIKKFCYELISNTFIDFKASHSCMLVLDCVKDLEDAEFVSAKASKYGCKITKALLFEVNEEQVEKSWRQRAKDIDIFHLSLGSARDYLFKWRKNSNDLVNYYTNLKMFSKIPGHPPLESLNLSLYDYPIYARPNYLQFMLLESKKIKNVLMCLYSVLNTTEFQFSLPLSFVQSFRDVKWIVNPTRYYVTIKADGVRCLLLKLSDNAYLITRKNEIYPCHIENDQLPENTVLDGELLPSSAMSNVHPKSSMSELKNSVFLAFDILAVSGDVLWKWPLSVRLESLRKLPMRKDILSVIREASADDQSSFVQNSDPQKLTIHCSVKGHRQSTPEDIKRCLDTKYPYACDGLIFTPDKAYVFGPDPLMFKWQSDIDIKSVISNPEVFEKQESTSASGEQFDCLHPANRCSFDKLLANITELVKRGEVNRTVDPATGLEIFSYCTPASLKDSIMLRLSRGLVLHPPSKTIATKPFVRFYEGDFKIYKVYLFELESTTTLYVFSTELL